VKAKIGIKSEFESVIVSSKRPQSIDSLSHLKLLGTISTHSTTKKSTTVIRRLRRSTGEVLLSVASTNSTDRISWQWPKSRSGIKFLLASYRIKDNDY